MKSKIINYIGWILQGLLAIQFVMAGINKFIGPNMNDTFTNWGYPDNFYLFAGFVEILGAILIVIPRFMIYGAGIIAFTMISAFITLYINGQPVGDPIPSLIIAIVVVLIRRK